MSFFEQPSQSNFKGVVESSISTESLLEAYQNRAKSLRHRPNTIISSKRALVQFLRWLDAECIRYDLVRYADMLAFIEHCKSLSNSRHTINMKLIAINHLYTELVAMGELDKNPVQDLRLKRKADPGVGPLLTWDQLKSLYDGYNAPGIVGKRNKVMLGVLTYQGLATGEMDRLRVEDVDLDGGKLYVPAGARSNERVLDLDGTQVIGLQKYIVQVRPVLLAMTEKQTDKLFLSSGSSGTLTNAFYKLLKRLRTIEGELVDIKQIRASVIAHWLKLHHIRKVQYMAGHRYVSSTERYRTDRLEGLQDQVERIHPLSGDNLIT